MSSCPSTNTNQDEEIWINMLSDKDQKYRDKFVAKMSNDMNLKAVMKSLKLITPASQIITGEFNSKLINRNRVKK